MPSSTNSTGQIWGVNNPREQSLTIVDICLTEHFDSHFPGLSQILLSYQRFLHCLLTTIGLVETFSSDQLDKALERHGAVVRHVKSTIVGIQHVMGLLAHRIEVSHGRRTLKGQDLMWQGHASFDVGQGIKAVINRHPIHQNITIHRVDLNLENLAACRFNLSHLLNRLRQEVFVINPSLPPLVSLRDLVSVFPDLVSWRLDRTLDRSFTRQPERLLHIHKRQPVDYKLRAPPNGKLSGVVELKLYFRLGREILTGCGTGWLMNRNTIVTAGHNVSINGKRLVGMKATVNSTSPGQEQSLMGVSVVVSWAWHHMVLVASDLALIRVEGLFDAKPLRWMKSPVDANGLSCQVVGFPGDRVGMWYSECELHIKDCDESSQQILDHTGETVGGNSGSPIIKQPEGVVVGIHRGGGQNLNEAVVIDDGPNNLFEYHRILQHATSYSRSPRPPIVTIPMGDGVTRYQIPPPTPVSTGTSTAH
ncbi:trypsin-like cysteine/serine peptidase domain-containing protein [Cladorrhinum sp. PSN332]|nr:trypsin-like cysteine/serine peptidase domain-containing protein [Cladorrhinum sp. PSN332]